MRPIEFRAWDKRTDQMNEIDIANAQGGPLYTFDDPNMIFMQFTGFYDINGDPARKLWEGDIIIDRLGYHGVIYWGKKSGQWRVKFNYNNDATLWSALEQPLAKYAGNVWENPDLVPWYQPYSRHQENGKEACRMSVQENVMVAGDIDKMAGNIGGGVVEDLEFNQAVSTLAKEYLSLFTEEASIKEIGL